jgi:hypothetical protein
MKRLKDKQILSGFWSVKKAVGAIPDSREGSKFVSIGNKIYLFGGFARDRYGDVH